MASCGCTQCIHFHTEPCRYVPARSGPVMGNFKSKVEAARMLRRREVEARTGLARSTIYDWMRAGRFPRPVSLGSRAVRWREQDIDQWIAAHVAQVVTSEGGR